MANDAATEFTASFIHKNNLPENKMGSLSEVGKC